MGNTIHGITADPAIIRIPGSKKALALTTVSKANICKMDPILGTHTTVTLCYNLLKRVGAKPLAITNCLNFGNPEDPEVMMEFSGTVLAMAKACKLLDFPVVSGNVSFYNETDGKGILPTLVVGGVGLIEDYENGNYNFPR
jgi:phosphoribosylformylglycinamidine synthase